MTILRGALSVAVFVILSPTDCLACDPAALKHSVEQLGGANSPFAGTITFDCIDILRDPNNKSLLSKFVNDFVSAAQLSKNMKAVSIINTCSAEEVRAACVEANN